MVRLRLKAKIEAVEYVWFQSHYGAIATSLHNGETAIPNCFQSHYGAIATVIIDEAWWALFPFQSHYGALATW